jgi:hypothetical protein
MERFELRLKNQFFIDKFNKYKFIACQDLKFNQKHKNYEFYNRYEKIRLGAQLCDFMNTDFSVLNSAREFIDKYGITTIAHLSDIKIYQHYSEEEYNQMVGDVINNLKDKLEMYKNAFIEDITYIYNINDLEELNNLSPVQRLHILRDSKKESEVKKLYDSNNLKLTLNNFGDFTEFSITHEDDAQESVKYVNTDLLNTYCFESNDIIQTFIIELFEMTEIETTAIKKCKNCGKFFVPDNRVDELYCSNIYENNKTCKEVGPFRVKQKLMQENDDLRIYRNVYQKLLLRTRRNPNNDQYENDFSQFKKKNIELKKKVEKGKLSQAEYMEWLAKQ